MTKRCPECRYKMEQHGIIENNDVYYCDVCGVYLSYPLEEDDEEELLYASEEDKVHCSFCSEPIGTDKEVYEDETVDYEVANGEPVCISCYKDWIQEWKNDLDMHYTPFHAESFAAWKNLAGGLGGRHPENTYTWMRPLPDPTISMVTCVQCEQEDFADNVDLDGVCKKCIKYGWPRPQSEVFIPEELNVAASESFEADSKPYYEVMVDSSRLDNLNDDFDGLTMELQDSLRGYVFSLEYGEGGDEPPMTPSEATSDYMNQVGITTWPYRS